MKGRKQLRVASMCGTEVFITNVGQASKVRAFFPLGLSFNEARALYDALKLATTAGEVIACITRVELRTGQRCRMSEVPRTA